PRCLLRRRQLLGGGATCLGQRGDPLAVTLLGGDQSLIGEQLQRRVDGARARTPSIATALTNGLDHLVAMHRPLEEQQQHGCANVAATPARPPAHPRIGIETEATTATEATVAPTATTAEPAVPLRVVVCTWIHVILLCYISMRSRYIVIARMSTP